MHILLTNDDGPPSKNASPYVQTFVEVLRSPPFNHKVSVVLPTTQRSWIGKAHLLPPTSFPVGGHGKNDDITEVIKPVYYDPIDHTTHASPRALFQARGTGRKASVNGDGHNVDDYYVLVPGTPATCVQLGLFHHQLLFPTSDGTETTDGTPTRAPIDLILSGPNYGRNTTAAFALSSGTIGGALEGAICGIRAIAFSFAFFTRQESLDMIREACTLGAKITSNLYAGWENGGHGVADLYSVNIPLVTGVSQGPVRWTWMLDNKWGSGSLYKTHDETEGRVKPEGRTGEDLLAANGHANGHVDVKVVNDVDGAPTFKWSPQFTDIWKTVEQSAGGNDGLTIREHITSVTPLKANFQGMFGVGAFKGDMIL